MDKITSSTYSYNFIAPHSLDTCTERLQALDVKPLSVWHQHLKQRYRTDNLFNISISRAQANAYRFQIERKTAASGRYADFRASGVLQRLEDNQTKISFNVTEVGINRRDVIGCAKIPLLIFCVVMFITLATEKYGGAIWILLVAALLFLWAQFMVEGDPRLSKDSFINYFLDTLDARAEI